MSWMIVLREGKREVVDLRTRSRQGVRRSCQRAARKGQTVVAGFNGTGAVALAVKCYP